MTNGKRKKKAGSSRTEVFAMRLDPKLKYLAEIAARKQRRSLANFIEWAIEQTLSRVVLSEGEVLGNRIVISVLDAASTLWDLDPSARFLKLANNYPDLLTYEEQLIWKAINEIHIDEGYKDENGKVAARYHSFFRNGRANSVNEHAVKLCWNTLVAYSEDQASQDDIKKLLLEMDI